LNVVTTASVVLLAITIGVVFNIVAEDDNHPVCHLICADMVSVPAPVVNIPLSSVIYNVSELELKKAPAILPLLNNAVSPIKPLPAPNVKIG